MVSTRNRTIPKRAASPDVEPDVPKKKQAPSRGRSRKTAQPISDDEDSAPPPPAKKKQPPKKKATAAKVKDEPTQQVKDEPTQQVKDESTQQVKDEPIEDVKDEPSNEVKDEPSDEVKKESSRDTFREASKYGKTNGKDLSDGQYAKAANLIIPVDEECPLSSYQVYVDSDDGIIYDANLNQTNSGNNNNKFYRIQLLTDAKTKGSSRYYTWTRWGRVGEHGQSKQLGDGDLQSAMREFEKKFKDKSGLSWANRGDPAKPKKYVFLERSYEPDTEDEEAGSEQDGNEEPLSRSRSTSPAKCTLQAPVKSLMELIFNQQYMDSTMADMNYDAKKMPLGKLSKATITRGYQALKDLAALFDDATSTSHEEMERLSNLYYSYIPHAFGRNRAPIISDHERLKKEVLLLESLTDLTDAHKILNSTATAVHPLDARFKNLGLQETTPLSANSAEFTTIGEYLLNSNVHGVNYQILDIFRIERQGETERFDSFGKTASGDRRLLWHGSRSTNFGGILSQGLRIAPPEAPVSGYMFGKGIYLADASSKSANYCAASISGGHALLLLCEAELGKLQTLTDASYSAGDDALANGLHSTWGQGQIGPAAWKGADCVHPSLIGATMPDTASKLGNTNVPGAYLMYNEYICYDVAQVKLRYLLRVKM